MICSNIEQINNLFAFQDSTSYKIDMIKIPYGKQFIDAHDIYNVSQSLKSERITTGKYVDGFEKKIKLRLKSKYSLACSSGTAALHLSLLSIGLKRNDIVIMPAINFVSAYNLCNMIGADIYLADVDYLTGQMTPKTLNECIKKNKLKKIKLIITMYMGGYPENVTDLYKIKKKHKCFLIEDSCHAFGAKYSYKRKTYMIGSCKHSDISTFSLHPLKSITTGEGGIITTNNEKIFKKLILLRSHGIKRDKLFHWKYDVIHNGFNYRISDINCALGVSQLTKLNKFIKKRKKIYNHYYKHLKKFSKFIELPKYQNKNNASFHLFLLKLNFSELNSNKDDFIKFMLKNKIICQFHYIPIYKFQVWRKKNIKLQNCEKYYESVISLPIFFNLRKTQIDFIIKKIIVYLQNNKKSVN